MPLIYNYLCHRDFLRDLFIEQKQLSRPLTHRLILKKMGISSTGFLSNVIVGKKNLSREQSTKLGRILGLAPRERHYFRLTVMYTQVKSLEEKKKFLDRMMQMRNSKLCRLSEGQLDLFSKWYYVYIRDMLFFVDFKDDYEALAHLLDPAIKVAEAQEAIEALSGMGLIAKDERGFFRPVEKIITTGDEAHSVQLANFQLTTMDLAKRALEMVPANRRDISFVSLTLSPETFAAVKSEIQSFRKKLLLIAKEEVHPLHVYQCNIQFFPVSRDIEAGHE
jgi:uncharacterized protein (TIGR02147 family)